MMCLLVGIVSGLNKIGHLSETLQEKARFLRRSSQSYTVAQDDENGFNLATAALIHDDAEGFAYVLQGLVAVSTIANHMDYSDKSPSLQFAHIYADIRT